MLVANVQWVAVRNGTGPNGNAFFYCVVYPLVNELYGHTVHALTQTSYLYGGTCQYHNEYRYLASHPHGITRTDTTGYTRQPARIVYERRRSEDV